MLRNSFAARLSAAVSVVSAAFVLAACGDDDSSSKASTTAKASGSTEARGDVRIEFAMPGVPGDKFFNVIRNGAEQAGKDLGVEVTYNETKKTDFQEQARLIRAVIAKKPDAMVVADHEAATLNRPIKEAVDAGIPVIVINAGASEVSNLGALAFVGGFDEVASGELAGRRMKQDGVTKPICFNVDVGSTIHDQRCEGFEKGFGAEVETVGGDIEDRTKTRNAIKAILQRSGDVDGIFTTAAPAGEEAVAAVKASGKQGRVDVGTYDLTPAVLGAATDGTISFAIDQQQWLQGYIPVRQLTHLLRYKFRPAPLTHTGPGLVTKENAAEVVDLTKRDIR